MQGAVTVTPIVETTGFNLQLTHEEAATLQMLCNNIGGIGGLESPLWLGADAVHSPTLKPFVSKLWHQLRMAREEAARR